MGRSLRLRVSFVGIPIYMFYVLKRRFFVDPVYSLTYPLYTKISASDMWGLENTVVFNPLLFWDHLAGGR